MSRIIIEKESNKPQQPQLQAESVKILYDNKNEKQGQDEPNQPNNIQNPPLFNMSSQPAQFHPQNINEKNQIPILTPIVQISPFVPIPPIQQRDEVSEPDFNNSELYSRSYNIFGTEMTAKEADDLFDDAEKLVGWSYWKINE